MAALSAEVAIWAIPAIAPAVLMVAGHYFPWAATPLSRLNENQSRVYGVLGILLPVMAAVWLGEELGATISAWETIGLMWLAAVSAGWATVWVWGIDARMKLQRDITEERHRSQLLRSYAEERDID